MDARDELVLRIHVRVIGEIDRGIEVSVRLMRAGEDDSRETEREREREREGGRDLSGSYLHKCVREPLRPRQLSEQHYQDVNVDAIPTNTYHSSSCSL